MQKPMKAAQITQKIISLMFISILPLLLLGCTARAVHHDVADAFVYIRLIIAICARLASDLLNELDLLQRLGAIITSLPALDAIKKL